MAANTVAFTAADGKELALPLELLLKRHAVIARRVNGEDIALTMGAVNQLWIPGMPAKYYLRDIRGIRFSEEAEPPALDDFVDDGHDYTNRPNIGMKAEYMGRVGEPLAFEGWADDYDRRIVAVQLSFDGGTTWTEFATEGADEVRLVQWSFAWTPEKPGSYVCKARAVNERGDVSPTPAAHAFHVLP